jgi:hypothetical protein
VEKSPLIALEIVLGFVAPLGWAFWELWSLRRERRRDLAKARQREQAAGSRPDRGDG